MHHSTTTTAYGGVDWAIDSHAVCVVDSQGQLIAEFDVAHSADDPTRHGGHQRLHEAAA